MKSLLISAALLIVALVGCNQQKTTDHNEEQTVAKSAVVFKKINTEELKSLIKNQDQIQLVDIRTPAEVNAGTIQGSIINMDFSTGEFANQLDQLDTKKPVIVYCARGGRSAKAAQLLNDKGFKTVYDYTDGYTGWAADQ